jgi:hypothetical protein
MVQNCRVSWQQDSNSLQKELAVSQRSDIKYATVLERGEHWDASRPMRQQEQWQEHLAFLDASETTACSWGRPTE